jgi:hypothetical protein
MLFSLGCSGGDSSSPDTQAPTISLTAPGSGEVEGTVTISANADDDRGVVGVRFRLNGTDLGPEDLQPAYATTWNTAEYADGEYTITGVARDQAGNQSTASPVVVTVRNGPPPTGSVEVTTVTTGVRTDPDGYTVQVAGQVVAVSPSGVVTIPSIPVGFYPVTITGVASNCFVTGLVFATVTANAAAPVTFAVTCNHPVVEILYSRLDLFTSTLRELFTIRSDGTANTRVISNPDASLLDPAWAPDGQKIAFSRTQNGFHIVVRSLIDGSETQLTTDPGVFHLLPKWSPDGSKITFYRCISLGDCDVWVINADGTGAVNLTQTPDNRDQYPAWSPDGSKIVFSRTADLNEDLYVMNSDGSGVTRLTQDASPETFPAWSPDGSRILFVAERDANFDLYVVNADGSNQVRLTDDPEADGSPAWAPDGSRIAFTQPVNDGTLWVMNADGSAKVQVISGGVSSPAWRP